MMFGPLNRLPSGRGSTLSRIAMPAALLVMILTPAYGEGPPESISSICDQIEKNERLYDDLDVRLNHSFELTGPGLAEADEQSIVSRNTSVRYISQSPSFRLEANGTLRTLKGSRDFVRTRIFDGTVTRFIEDDRLANIVERRAEDHFTIRPHTILRWGIDRRNIPLSIYVRGADAIAAAFPEQAVDSSLDCVGTYCGTAESSGFQCQRVCISFGSGSADDFAVRYEFWLVPERNYLPARMLSYTQNCSKTIPLAEGLVDEFREVKPGVWFPVTATTTLFDCEALRDSSAQVPTQIYRCALTDVSLEPKYDRAVFDTLTIPDGAAVYHLDQDRNLTKSYVQGREGDRGVKPVAERGIATIWLVIINVFAFGALGILVARRMRGKPNGPQR